nr:hypothetical protein LVJ77_06330 [Conchiformibius kuhniae]
MRELHGALLTPSLIDCHTHLVFGGSRAAEWERRQNGVSYQQISAEGGGINHTVRATRATGEDELYRLAAQRLTTLLADGVGLVEIKSGYGLDLDSEAKMLRVAQRIKASGAAEVSATLLAAHAVPPEYAGRGDDYLDVVIDKIMPELWAQGLFECVDVFCETVGFTAAQTEKLFQAARALNIPVKGHTEQLSLQGGSALVARYGGWSVPTTLNIWTKRAWRRWRGQERWRCCCPARIIFCAKRKSRPCRCCANTAYRWRSPPTSIRVPAVCFAAFGDEHGVRAIRADPIGSMAGRNRPRRPRPAPRT